MSKRIIVASVRPATDLDPGTGISVHDAVAGVLAWRDVEAGVPVAVEADELDRLFKIYGDAIQFADLDDQPFPGWQRHSMGN